LKEVVLNDGLQRIGESAFNRCRSLICIIIPPSVTSIDNWAFYNCTALVEVVLHEGLKRIGRGAFDGCRLLCHIDIPHSVTYIGENACNGCAVTILVGPYNRWFRKNEAAVAEKEGYFLYREGVYVPKTVSRVCIHPSIERSP
jgi:hypothetical protein